MIWGTKTKKKQKDELTVPDDGIHAVVVVGVLFL